MFRGHTIKTSTAFLFISLLMMVSRPCLAQNNQPDLVDSSIRDITTVMMTGAGGAVLGLSTLSFVDEPKDHLRNILVGGAIGIIIGVGVVAYNQANVRKDDFKTGFHEKDGLEFSTAARHQWHQDEYQARADQVGSEVPSLTYSFNF